MIDNPDTKMEIQIDDELPFIPDHVIKIGVFYGKEEVTGDTDAVKSFIMTSSCAYAHYIYKGKEFKNYYKKGVWTNGTNDMPRFCICELLDIDGV